MFEMLFYTSIFMTLYAYFGYPLSLLILGLIYQKEVRKTPFYPPVTMIITAHNEEKRIRSKIENTMQIEYPKEKLQIILASDGSSDRTNEMVLSHGNGRIELLDISLRKGKENAQKEAVKIARGDVLVFTDVATMLDPGGLKEIVSNFADPTVGCVSSEDRLLGKDGKPCGEGFYVRYEMWLRRLETRVHSLVGLSGSFFAARKEVCWDFSGDMQSDFRTLLNSRKMGLRGISDPRSIGYYQDIADEKQEFQRKVRTVLRGLTVFFRHIEFLNASHYGFFAYQYFCHKLLRWLVPFFLIVMFMTNLLLLNESALFLLSFLCQLCFYSLAIRGWMGKLHSASPLLKVPTYFLTVNSSILVAWWRYWGGQRVTLWTPSAR